MPRNYKRKTTRAAAYTKENLRIAVAKVRSGEITNYAASVMYGIPKSTLNDRVLKKSGMLSSTLGRPPAIPYDMEQRLAKCLCTLEKWGWGLSRNEVLEITSTFIKNNKLSTPFMNNQPGPDWFIAFRKRHNLSIKKPQPVEYLRKRMTDPFVIHEYFDLLKRTLDELNIDDPNRIWNLDETSVSLDPSKTKVVGAIGKPCTRTTAGTGKENITVLTTVNAAGRKLNPLIIYKGKYVYQQWLAAEREDYEFEIAYAASKRGWIETDIFYNYMLKIIIPNLGEQRPVLMIYDGHSTHVNPAVISLAVENNITILKLPAHTSHLLQPLDLAVFKSFKSIWDRKLIEWQRQNVGTKLRKQAFAEIFAETWHLTNSKVIQNGFKKGGIYPFNDNVIPTEKYDPQAYRRWLTSQKKQKEVSSLKYLCLEIVNSTIASKNQSKHSDLVNTFEELLLNKVTQQNPGRNKKTTKLTRVAKGAEVITRKLLEENMGQANLKQTDYRTSQITGPSYNATTAKKLKNKNEQSFTQTEFEMSGPSNKIIRTSKVNQRTKRISHDYQIPCSSKLMKPNNNKNNKEKTKLNNTQSNRYTKRHLRRQSDSTTSESGDMSTHSDSDIFEISEKETIEEQSRDLDNNNELHTNIYHVPLNDEIGNDYQEINTHTTDLDSPSTSFSQVDNTTKNKVTILSSVRFTAENCRFVGLPAYNSLNLNQIDKKYDVSKNSTRKATIHKIDGKENTPKRITNITHEQNNEEYCIGDTVLVRYYTKIWKYYVGVIENICGKPLGYTIHYYKSVGKKENVKFISPKRRDYDTVPENLIVKKIELLQIRENPEEFTIMNDEDNIYFE